MLNVDVHSVCRNALASVLSCRETLPHRAPRLTPFVEILCAIELVVKQRRLGESGPIRELASKRKLHARRISDTC